MSSSLDISSKGASSSERSKRPRSSSPTGGSEKKARTALQVLGHDELSRIKEFLPNKEYAIVDQTSQTSRGIKEHLKRVKEACRNVVSKWDGEGRLRCTDSEPREAIDYRAKVLMGSFEENPENRCCYLQTPKEDKSRLLMAVSTNNSFAVRVLLNNPVPRHDSRIAFGALKLACTHNNTKIVDLLLKEKGPQRAKPDSDDSEILINAAMKNSFEIVKLLFNDNEPNRVKPDARNSITLYFACLFNHADVVKMLLGDTRENRVDPNAGNSEALRHACLYGKTEIVKILLDDKRTDPNAGNPQALYQAMISISPNTNQIVDMLTKDKRVKNIDQIRNEAMRRR